MRPAAFVIVVSTLAACHHPRPRTLAAPNQLGTTPATRELVVDGGVSDVRIFIREPEGIIQSPLGTRDARDSVEFQFTTDPTGCAEADVRPGHLGIAHRARRCSVKWVIRVPPRVADVRVRVSVGDVEINAPSDRSVRLHSGVGSVQLTIDGRRLEHSKSPGAGDEIRLGDRSALPRVDVSTGVGSVRAELGGASLNKGQLR